MGIIKEMSVSNKLIQVLAEDKIKKLSLVFTGNSITSGFTVSDKVIPMGQRIPTIILQNLKELNVGIYDVAIAGDNSDEHLLNNYINNTPLKDYVDFNRANYFVDGNMGAKCNITEEEFEQYYNFTYNSDITIQEAMFSEQKEEANIVVYCGLTGKFLDNFDRGVLGDMVNSFSKIKQDYGSAHGFLSSISNKNRQGKNTQVYIIGVPNFLGIRVAEIWNSKLRKLAKYYPNAVFVEPVIGKMFYKNGIDIHYDASEYEKAIVKIFTAMIENYKNTKIHIEIDRLLHQAGLANMKTNFNKVKDLDEKIISILEKYGLNKIEMGSLLRDFDKRYKLVYPHEFYYLKDRDLIKTIGSKL